MSETISIHKLTGAIFKILPMKEEELKGEEVYLLQYIDSIKTETMGMLKTYPSLSNNSDFLRIVNTMQGMDWEASDLKKYKSEVLKMTNLLNKIEAEFEEE